MRSSPTSLLLGFALAATLASAPPPSAARAQTGQSEYFSPRPEYFQIGGTCAMEVSPDKAVIVGGVSSSALKPTDAISQLEKQLGLMKIYITAQHGDLQMMERVRTLKTPQPGREETDPPFQVVQRLQIALPADAPVDAILEKLIDLGFDRFGENVLNGVTNRREAVVRFRISDFDSKLKDLQQKCTADAWKEWCNSPAGTANCPSQTPPYDLDLQIFNVRSKEAPMRLDGNSTAWQFTATKSQRPPDPPDLLGNLTVHLEGNITLVYHREEAKP